MMSDHKGTLRRRKGSMSVLTLSRVVYLTGYYTGLSNYGAALHSSQKQVGFLQCDYECAGSLDGMACYIMYLIFISVSIWYNITGFLHRPY